MLGVCVIFRYLLLSEVNLEYWSYMFEQQVGNYLIFTDLVFDGWDILVQTPCVSPSLIAIEMLGTK